MRNVAIRVDNPEEFMEDEEEVIMALITALPSLVYYLGGKEYSPLIFESLEMLLFVDNPVIKSKVQETI